MWLLLMFVGPYLWHMLVGESVNTVVASHLLIVRAKSITILRKYEGLKVSPAFGESNSYQHGPRTHLRCTSDIRYVKMEVSVPKDNHARENLNS